MIATVSHRGGLGPQLPYPPASSWRDGRRVVGEASIARRPRRRQPGPFRIRTAGRSGVRLAKCTFARSVTCSRGRAPRCVASDGCSPPRGESGRPRGRSGPRVSVGHAPAVAVGCPVPDDRVTDDGRACGQPDRARPVHHPWWGVGSGHRARGDRGQAAPVTDLPSAFGPGAAGAHPALLGRRPALRHRVPSPRARDPRARVRPAARRAGRTNPRQAPGPAAPAVGDLRDQWPGRRAGRGVLQGAPRGHRRSVGRRDPRHRP